MNTTNWIIGIFVLILIGGGAYLLMGNGNQKIDTTEGVMENAGVMEGEAMKNEEGTMKLEGDAMREAGGETMMQKGSYEAYAPEKLALAETGKVVLFFRASWCPTCRALDADIKAHIEDVPEGVTILDVDYDKSTALKQKYGVTMQHTLVQVDAKGNLITKWTGSPTLMALAENIK